MKLYFWGTKRGWSWGGGAKDLRLVPNAAEEQLWVWTSHLTCPDFNLCLLDESYNLMVSKIPLGSQTLRVLWETLKDKERKTELAI